MDPTTYSGLVTFVVLLWVFIFGFYGVKRLKERRGSTFRLEEDLGSSEGVLGQIEEWFEIKHELLGPLWWKARCISIPLSTALTLLGRSPEDTLLNRLMVFLFLELVFSQWVGIVGYILLIAYLPEKDPSKTRRARVDTAKDISDRLKAGRKQAKQGDLRGAIKTFSSVLKIDPDHSEALYLIGGCHYQLGRDKAAIQSWKQAALCDPRHKKTREWLNKVAPGWDKEKKPSGWGVYAKKGGILAAKGAAICSLAAGIVIFIDTQPLSRPNGPRLEPPPLEPKTVSQSGLSLERYADSKGMFSVHPPAGWGIQTFPHDPRARVAFLGYDPGDIRITVRQVAGATVESLEEEARREQERKGIDMHIERTSFLEADAVRREYEVETRRFRQIDFVWGGAVHQLLFSAHPESFGGILPLAQASLDTYEPLTADSGTFASKEKQAERKRQLARKAMDRGDLVLADRYVKEGLAAMPGETGLMAMAQDLFQKIHAPPAPAAPAGQ